MPCVKIEVGTVLVGEVMEEAHFVDPAQVLNQISPKKCFRISTVMEINPFHPQNGKPTTKKF